MTSRNEIRRRSCYIKKQIIKKGNKMTNKIRKSKTKQFSFKDKEQDDIVEFYRWKIMEQELQRSKNFLWEWYKENIILFIIFT